MINKKIICINDYLSHSCFNSGQLENSKKTVICVIISRYFSKIDSIIINVISRNIQYLQICHWRNCKIWVLHFWIFSLEGRYTDTTHTTSACNIYHHRKYVHNKLRGEKQNTCPLVTIFKMKHMHEYKLIRYIYAHNF